jgi:Tfp pilus assembly protein PilO/Tfp pilus assembly protein PilN
VKNHEEVKKQLAVFKQREDAIAKLQSARSGPTSVLLELAHVLTQGRGPTVDAAVLAQLNRDNPLSVPNPSWDPKRLWLVSFKEGDRVVMIDGLARDGEDVSELARRLALSTFFGEIKLLPASRSLMGTQKIEMVKFQLQAKAKYLAMAAAKPAAAVSQTQISTPIKVVLFVFVMFTIGVGFYFVVYSDVVDQLESARKAEAKLHDDLSQAREIEALYQRDLAELSEKQQKARDLNKTLPESAESPAFLSAIQSVANASGIQLTSWEPMDDVPQQFFTKVPMKLKISGRFHQIAKFFYGIGQVDRIINIENINVSLAKTPSEVQTGEDVMIDAECLATAFHTGNRKGATPTKPGQPAPAASGAAPASSGGK